VHNARVPAVLVFLLALTAHTPPGRTVAAPLGSSAVLQGEEELRAAADSARAGTKPAPPRKSAAPAAAAPRTSLVAPAGAKPSTRTSSKRAQPPESEPQPPPEPPPPSGSGWISPAEPLPPLVDLSEVPPPSEKPRVVDAYAIRGGVPLRWRRADIEPDTGTGVSYRKGGAPYPGVMVEGEVFGRAWAGAPRWFAPLGLGAEYQHGFLSTSAEGESFDSSERRAAVDLLYRERVAPKTLVGGRLGYGLHEFDVESGAPPLSSRRTGLRLGVDLEQRLFGDVDLVAGGVVLPWFEATGAEADAHGSSSGWGFELLAGLDGRIPLASGLRWRVAYELTRFSDEFGDEPGSLSSGGSGTAVYHAVLLTVGWRR
jgi:hypothetical protein